MRFRNGWRKLAFLTLATTTLLSACSPDIETKDLLRSDPPIAGYTGSMQYTISASPNGDGETNSIAMRGVNGASPMPLLTTSFGKGANSRTQTAQVTAADGTAINVLSMNKWGSNVGLTDYLDTQVATYEQRDALGNRVCGAKVRLDFKPNIAQIVLKDDYQRAWDSLFYYTIPCGEVAQPASSDGKPAETTNGDTAKVITKPNTVLDLSKAKLIALVINQQFAPRVTGDPIFFNRGHSVTIVGGRAAGYVGGWWERPAAMLNASNLVIDMVKDLDAHDWLSFGNPANGGLVYSAGDADVYLSLKRIFLNRHDNYLVNFRADPSQPWSRVRIDPKYNTEWNDFGQMYQALKGEGAPNINDLVDQNTGLPKDLDNPNSGNTIKLKEIESAGCQNCPNPELEQIQFVDQTDGSPTFNQPIYAMTIRGWLGSQSSLVMFGKIPDSLESYQKKAVEHGKQTGMALQDNVPDQCPIQRDENNNRLEDKKQYSKQDCARWLAEGSLWDMLTHDADSFGFDLVGQFRVRDNSSWASHCSGSGEHTSCVPVATQRRMDAAYMFTDTDQKMQKVYTILQLLGEVGMRKLGLSYASNPYDGSGLDFAMAQSNVYNSYYTNMADAKHPYNPENLFMLDARALQLPQTLGLARTYLFGQR